MPRFAANLSMLYPELPFLDRFEAAAKDGFEAVEYLFPYAYPAEELVARLKAHGLRQVLFNAPLGPPACAARPACQAGRTNSAPVCNWRCATPPRWIARASTAWPACWTRAPTARSRVRCT